MLCIYECYEVNVTIWFFCSSWLFQSSYNDTYRHDVDRKVTFVVSDSDMSSVDGHEGTGS